MWDLNNTYPATTVNVLEAAMKADQGGCNKGGWIFLHCYTTPSRPQLTFGACTNVGGPSLDLRCAMIPNWKMKKL